MNEPTEPHAASPQAERDGQSRLRWFRPFLSIVTAPRWRRALVGSGKAAKGRGRASRVLVLANQTMAAIELFNELRSIDSTGHGQYFICVPANFVDTGANDLEGQVRGRNAGLDAARRRLEYTLSTLRAAGLSVDGDFGDVLPLRALEKAVEAFRPDLIVIATYTEERSAWLHHDVVERARQAFPAVPLTHVIARTSGDHILSR